MEEIQQRQIKRALYERKRHKKYLWFKNRGLLSAYFSRFKFNKIPDKLPDKLSEKVIPKMVWWRKLIVDIYGKSKT